MTKPAPILSWLHKLPEVGQPVTDLARREADIIKEMAEAEATHRLRLRNMRKALRNLARDAETAVAECGWSSKDVAEAKRKATPHVAVPSHDPEVNTCLPWCLTCFADVTDPVHVKA